MDNWELKECLDLNRMLKVRTDLGLVNKKEYPAIVRSHWVILPRELHRATAGPNGLIFIETQTGDCREEDIVRLEDDYGRLDSSEVSV